MTPEQRLAPAKWRVYLASLRAVVACSWLIHQLVSSPSGRWYASVPFAIYAAYTLVVLFTGGLEKAGRALFGLMADTVLFLVCASIASDPGIWLIMLFYYYLLLAAAVNHEWFHVVIISAASLTFFVLAQPVRTPVLAPAFLLSGIIVSLLALRKSALEERVASASRQAALFRSEAEKTRENERQRIAAEFHDGPLQNFVGLQMRLQVVRKILERNPSAGQDELRQVEDLVRNQSNEMRTFVRSMRALEVDGAGLIGSLRRMLDSFERDSGIAVTFTGGDVKTGADADTSREMLQVVREALHNVQKHARATRVAVTAAKNSDELTISVEDDGIGFPFSGRYTLEELENLRLGPLSIRRRVRGLGGSLELESWPGRGAVLRVRIAS